MLQAELSTPSVCGLWWVSEENQSFCRKDESLLDLPEDGGMSQYKPESQAGGREAWKEQDVWLVVSLM